MKTNNKNSISQALIDLDDIKKTLKEESTKTIKSMLAECVKNGLNESIEDDDKDDDTEEYTISDKDTNSETNTDEGCEDEKDSESCEDGKCDKDAICLGKKTDEEDNEEDEDSSDEDDSDDDSKFADFDKYKNEDGDFDFSGEKDDAADDDIIKVYKLLSDKDTVIVKKEGNRAEIKDNETGAEYVIDFGDDTSVEKVSDDDDSFDDDSFDDDDETLNEAIGDEEGYGENEMPEEGEDNFDLYDDSTEEVPFGDSGEPDDEIEGPEEDAEGPMGVESSDDEEGMMPAGLAENKNRKARKTMRENKEQVLFEVDLGYTDNYQSKDPIEGLSAEEPAKNKKDWDAGVPKGTKKPWAGKGSSAPFGTKVKSDLDEMDLSMDDSSADMPDMSDSSDDIAGLEEADSKVRKRSTAKTHLRQNEMNPKVTRHASKNGKYLPKVDESYNALVKKVNKLVNENKILKNAFGQGKKALDEAVLLNMNLGQFVRLVQENSTTKAERFDIINRFDKVKTPSESKALYESISRELSSVKKPNVTLEEKQMTVAGTKQLNESKVYENPGLAEIRNMMSRMDKKNFI